MIFIQETPSHQPVTSYMDDICRPLLTQNKIRDEDLRIGVFECKTTGESQTSFFRYCDILPFDRVRGWRAVDFPWVKEKGSMVVAALNTLKRKQDWTPGALTVIIFNISTLDFKPSMYYQYICFPGLQLTLLIFEEDTLLNDVGGKDGCILVGLILF